MQGARRRQFRQNGHDLHDEYKDREKTLPQSAQRNCNAERYAEERLLKSFSKMIFQFQIYQPEFILSIFKRINQLSSRNWSSNNSSTSE